MNPLTKKARESAKATMRMNYIIAVTCGIALGTIFGLAV